MATNVRTFQGGDSRVFIQDGVGNPTAPFVYIGCASLGEADQDLGTGDPVYCPSSTKRGAWDIVDTIETAPALGSMDFTQQADPLLRDIWWTLKEKGCYFTIAAPIGKCTRPDSITDWDSVMFFTYAKLTSFTAPAINALNPSDNGPSLLAGSNQYREIRRILRLAFEELAGSTIVAEVLDGFYYDVATCGTCGVISDGCRKQYNLTAANSGSPGLSSQLVVTIDDKATYFTLDLGLGGLSANRMAAVGQYVVVVSQANLRHIYALFTDVDAQTVGAFTAVTSGYVATKGPRAIYSATPSLTYIAAAGGYMYLMSDPTAAVTVLTDGTLTVQDFNDVHGVGNTIVAVGGSNAVIYSDNNGDTLSSVTGPEVGVNLTAVWCKSESEWWVGTGTGKAWYTLNKGVSWTQKGLPGGITIVNDIAFVDESIGYISGQVGSSTTSARMLWTIDGGYSFQTGTPRLKALPSAERYNFITTCGYNEFTAGGRVSAGGDGKLATAQ